MHDGEAGASEEAQDAKAAHRLVRPPQDEVNRHMITHLPFRSWCPHCVRGKSHGKHHSRVKSDDKCVPTVCFGYMYMHESSDKSEDRGMPILVARDKS